MSAYTEALSTMTPQQYAISIFATYWENPIVIAEKIGLKVFYDESLPVSAQFNDATNSIEKLNITNYYTNNLLWRI